MNSLTSSTDLTKRAEVFAEAWRSWHGDEICAGQRADEWLHIGKTKVQIKTLTVEDLYCLLCATISLTVFSDSVCCCYTP